MPVVAVFVLGVVAGTAGAGHAQVGRPAARLTPLIEGGGVRPGAHVHLILRVELPEGLHVQSNAPRDPALVPTTLTIEAAAGVSVEEVVYPAAGDLRQAGQDRPLAVFGPAFSIRVRAGVAATVPPGVVAIRGRLRYQACNDKLCFPPGTAEATWAVRVDSSGPPGGPPQREGFDRRPANLEASGTVAPLQAPPASPTLIADVRAAIAAGDFAGGERLVAAHRATRGVTPEMLVAKSWLGRGALGARRLEQAEAYARQTYELARVELQRRPMDEEPQLPIAIGAAIEVLAKVAAERGARGDAVAFLQGQLETYHATSIHKRIQKNIHLLSLEGSSAPPLDVSEYWGAKPPDLVALKGQVVLLFFWAHWCSDCKAQSPLLERLLARYGPRGLMIVAPTQRFGYVAGGVPAAADEETRYVEQVRRTSYAWLARVPVPLSETNHQRYGVSTTPTLVLVDRASVIRLYHPGQMTEAELEPLVRRLVGGREE
ncbi:MAG: redoxin domain-containing protein [Verrucomicrobia bacterium]|nr:redoxin domain-containing protein [Verrucomicrobiota bacterium]